MISTRSIQYLGLVGRRQGGGRGEGRREGQRRCCDRQLPPPLSCSSAGVSLSDWIFDVLCPALPDFAAAFPSGYRTIRHPTHPTLTPKKKKKREKKKKSHALIRYSIWYEGKIHFINSLRHCSRHALVFFPPSFSFWRGLTPMGLNGLIPGSRRSMQGYILTHPGLNREKLRNSPDCL